MLPHLDSAALYRRLDANPNSLDKINSRPVLNVFVCPQDQGKFGKQGELSYVANAVWGRFAVGKDDSVSELREHSLDVDWDSDGNISDDELDWTHATGLFWRPHPKRSGMTLEVISEADGQSNTILFTENVNSGSWMSRKTFDIGFVVDLDSVRFEQPSDPLKRLLTKPGSLGPFAFKATPRELSGRSPVPSSHHPGVFNTKFADGRAVFINVNIDPRVFLALMTPDGHRFGEPADLNFSN